MLRVHALTCTNISADMSHQSAKQEKDADLQHIGLS